MGKSICRTRRSASRPRGAIFPWRQHAAAAAARQDLPVRPHCHSRRHHGEDRLIFRLWRRCAMVREPAGAAPWRRRQWRRRCGCAASTAHSTGRRDRDARRGTPTTHRSQRYSPLARPQWQQGRPNCSRSWQPMSLLATGRDLPKRQLIRAACLPPSMPPRRESLPQPPAAASHRRIPS